MPKTLSKTRTINMELGNEERLLAPKSAISQKSSASVVPRKIQQSVWNERNKKGEGEVTNKKTGVFRNTSPLIVSITQDNREAKDVEKLHWEPLGKQTEHLE